jgi:hypothetical protein
MAEHDLDRASLLRILEKLEPRDVLACELASPQLAQLGKAPTLWRRALAHDFGVHLEGPGVAAVDLQTAYARLAGCKAPAAALRFLAAYTDGGTDGGDDELNYWADHAFVPNHLSPHCSDGPIGISIVGLLKVGLISFLFTLTRWPIDHLES